MTKNWHTAEEALQVKQIWRKFSSKYVSAGHKVKQRCVADAFRVNGCPAGVYLQYHADSTKVSLFKIELRHATHIGDWQWGFPFKLKNFIRKTFSDSFARHKTGKKWKNFQNLN